jgi:hypothetical protein
MTFGFSQINTGADITLDHIVQFTNLWEVLQTVHLNPNTPYLITWKLTNDGCYSSKMTYNMQFLGHTKSSMPSLVWKPWAPPSAWTFAWSIILKVHLPLCVVLVINDNPYRLMFSLSLKGTVHS